jgi:hypothetical protein
MVSLALLMSTALTSCQYTGQKPQDSQPSVGLGTTECLLGITPGQTSIEQAEQILTGLGFEVYHCPVGVCLGWSGMASRPGSVLARAANSVHARKASGPVTLISAGLDSELPLQKVLDAYGSPEKYLAFETDFTLIEGGHTPGVLLVLYNTSQGRIFEAWIPTREQEAFVDAQTGMDWLHCFLPTTAERLIQDIPELGHRLPWQDQLRDWLGIESIYVWPFGTVH